MPAPARRHPMAASLLGLLGLLASGCSSFRESRKLDMSPFADNTVATIGQAAALNKPVVWIQLREYRTHPSVVKAQQSIVPLRRLMRGIAFYSAQVVSLNDSGLPEKKKLAGLARYLKEVVRAAAEDNDAEEWNVKPGDVDRIAAEVEQKETYLEGLAAADPLVNATLQYGIKVLDRIDQDVAQAAADVEREVDVRYAAISANAADLEKVEQQTLRGFGLLYRYRLGETDQLAALRSTIPAATSLEGAKAPTAKAVGEAEVELVAQLARIKAAKDLLEPDLNAYRESKLELDRLRSSTIEFARVARVTLILWARSHRNLGHGVAVPAAIDLGKIISGVASKGASAILPF